MASNPAKNELLIFHAPFYIDMTRRSVLAASLPTAGQGVSVGELYNGSEATDSLQ